MIQTKEDELLFLKERVAKLEQGIERAITSPSTFMAVELRALLHDEEGDR